MRARQVAGQRAHDIGWNCFTAKAWFMIGLMARCCFLTPVQECIEYLKTHADLEARWLSCDVFA
eukprot:14299865-Heterocapsa_arctica.AAC.1